MKVKLEITDPVTQYQANIDCNQEILSQLLDLGFLIDHSCGGSGTCGTCQFECLTGQEFLSPKNQVETEFWEDRPSNFSLRLSCQSLVTMTQNTYNSDIKIQIKYHYPIINP